MLNDAHGNPLTIDGLWGLQFGNGAAGGNAGTLYFTAGIPGPDNVEDHGLFGALAPVPEPGTLGIVGMACVCLGLTLRRKRQSEAEPAARSGAEI
jgi:hypothetical protein